MREERKVATGYLLALVMSISAWIGLCLALGATLRQCSEVEAATGKAAERGRRLEEIRRAFDAPAVQITDPDRRKQ